MGSVSVDSTNHSFQVFRKEYVIYTQHYRLFFVIVVIVGWTIRIQLLTVDCIRVIYRWCRLYERGPALGQVKMPAAFHIRVQGCRSRLWLLGLDSCHLQGRPRWTSQAPGFGLTIWGIWGWNQWMGALSVIQEDVCKFQVNSTPSYLRIYVFIWLPGIGPLWIPRDNAVVYGGEGERSGRRSSTQITGHSL